VTQGSVSCWISSLNQGELDAAQNLWDRYANHLVEIARRKLGNAPKGAADEEDVAQNVFASICRGAAAGRLMDVKNRDDLWWLLLAVTRQKVANHVRNELAQKRGAGRVCSESALRGSVGSNSGFRLDYVVGEEPTADFIAMLNEQHLRLLEILPSPSLRQVAVFRIEGYTVAEIAARLGISVRAVERKLQLIRSKWSAELVDAE
jgi:RNA polymerase sigma factor (sigma-70 family)